MNKRRSTCYGHDPEHHESCAVQIDPVLRCNCARQDSIDAWQAKRSAEMLADRARRSATATARFWVYYRGALVKISVAPGEILTHIDEGPTEEGWCSDISMWRHEGKKIVWVQGHKARDCDGEHNDYRVRSCPLDWLAASPPPVLAGKPALPAWVDLF